MKFRNKREGGRSWHASGWARGMRPGMRPGMRRGCKGRGGVVACIVEGTCVW